MTLISRYTRRACGLRARAAGATITTAAGVAAAALLTGLMPAAAWRHHNGAVQLRGQRPGRQPDRLRHVR